MQAQTPVHFKNVIDEVPVLVKDVPDEAAAESLFEKEDADALSGGEELPVARDDEEGIGAGVGQEIGRAPGGKGQDPRDAVDESRAGAGIRALDELHGRVDSGVSRNAVEE